MKRNSTLKRFSFQALAITLVFALGSPAFAVVFTNPASITVNDATAIGFGNPYPSTINVTATGTITTMWVTINNITSTFPDDLDVMLVAPDGTSNLVLMSDVGGSDDVTNASITFIDGFASLPDATKLPSGQFAPTNIGTGDTWPAPAPAPSSHTSTNSAFGAASPTGTWSLYVVDDLGADMSTIGNGWSITMQTTTTNLATYRNNDPIHAGDGAKGRATPYGSTIVASGLTGAITDINVTLTNVSHLNPDDIDIMLVGPSGKRILLLSDAGGTGDVVNQTLTFDDAGAATIPDAGPMVSGTFRPSSFGTGDSIPDMTGPYPYAPTAGSATLASVFNGTEPNGTWRLFVVDDAAASAGSIMGGWSIDIVAGGSYGAKRFTSADLSGDGRTDVSVYRDGGDWWWRTSDAYQNNYAKWGAIVAPPDVPVPSDYDGDNKTDLAIFRTSTSDWIILNSATSTVSYVRWGASTDKLVPADYDGDGRADIAIYRQSMTDGTFWVRQSSNGVARVVQWGLGIDIPVRGHFEGTNGADFAVFRPHEGTWYILNNAGNSSRAVQWGVATDNPVPADYDGDGKTDVAVFRSAEGNWYIFNSSTGVATISKWGAAGSVPVAGDYDGDSKTDLAVWVPTEGGWYITNSGAPYGTASIRLDSWGISSDTALPKTYFP